MNPLPCARTIGLLAAFALTWPAQAAPITYETSGVFTPTSYRTDGAVGFLGSDAGYFGVHGPPPFQGPGTITLGAFMVEPVPDGMTLPYNDVPFTITLTLRNLPEGPSNQPVGVDTLSLAGVLNGSVTGRYQSSLTATVNSVTWIGGDSPLPFPLSAFHVDTPLLLAASDTLASASAPNYGITPLNATITIPEPASWACFGLAGVAFWLRRTRRPPAVGL